MLREQHRVPEFRGLDRSSGGGNAAFSAVTLALSNADQSTDRGPQVINRDLWCCLEMEPHPSSYQVLAQVTAVVGVDLCAGVIQVVIFDEGAPPWRPIII